MKYRVICYEDVSTELTVDAPSEKVLREWLEEKGGTLVSEFMHRQVVREREYDIEVQPGRDIPVDWDITENG